MTARRSFPRWVFGVGAEPDPRFTLANERTFLAWMRTALAVLAAGVALEAFNVPIDPGFRLAASITLMTLAILLPITAWIGWMRVERSLREDGPLPASHIGLVLAVGIMTASVLLLIGLLTV